jgi:surface antigen
MRPMQMLCGVIVPILLASGCSTMNNTERGAAAGGVIGAGTGALVGSATGHPGAGALVGAGVGAVSGGLIGNAVDKSEQRQAAIAAANNPPRGPLGITDVAQLAQAHVSDALIINQIRATGSVFRLSSMDTIWLKQNGVSDAVVQEMLVSANRVPSRVYSAVPVYVAEPPPVAVGVGIGYGRRW